MLNEKSNENREQVGFYRMEDLVPKDHILRKIDKAIDFSFLYDLVKDRYSEDTGRPQDAIDALARAPFAANSRTLCTGSKP